MSIYLKDYQSVPYLNYVNCLRKKPTSGAKSYSMIAHTEARWSADQEKAMVLRNLLRRLMQECYIQVGLRRRNKWKESKKESQKFIN